MSRIKTALNAFHVDLRRYPTSAEGLEVLIKRPDDIPAGQWRGPYLESDSVLTDEWGHAYVYLCPGLHHTNGFDLYTKGPDGVSTTGGEDPDDLNNWLPMRRAR